MKKKINKIIKGKSKLLIITFLLECILCLWALIYFNYMDHLNYNQSISASTQSLALMIQNMYTSTWWALIILAICLGTIFSLVTLIYNDIKFHFISICLWFILLILAINFKDSFVNNLATFAIFIPILTINIISYKNQKKLNNV